MSTSFPIWNSTCTSILLNEDGSEVWMEETEVRREIGKRSIGVFRPLGSGRDQMKLYKREKEQAKEKRPFRRLQSAQPNVIRVSVGDTHRVYMHHAERCEAHYDGRQMPVVKYNHYAAPGTAHKRGSYKIDPSCL